MPIRPDKQHHISSVMTTSQEKASFGSGDPFDFDTEKQKAEWSHWGQKEAKGREKQKTLKTESTAQSSSLFKGCLVNWGIEVSFKERLLHVCKHFRGNPPIAGIQERTI